jgi:hypothetical protein
MDFVANDDTCPICFEQITLVNTTRTECGHRFHSSCLIKHLSSAHSPEYNCPVCRHTFDTLNNDSSDDDDDDDDDDEEDGSGEGEEYDEDDCISFSAFATKCAESEITFEDALRVIYGELFMGDTSEDDQTNIEHTIEDMEDLLYPSSTGPGDSEDSENSSSGTATNTNNTNNTDTDCCSGRGREKTTKECAAEVHADGGATETTAGAADDAEENATSGTSGGGGGGARRENEGGENEGGENEEDAEAEFAG